MPTGTDPPLATLLAGGAYDQVVEQGKPRLAAARRAGEPHALIALLLPMGMAAQYQGSFPEAATWLQEARNLAATEGTAAERAYAAMAWGDYLLAADQATAALKVLQEGVAAARQGEGIPHLAALLNNLGNTLLAQRNLAAAEAAFQEALPLARRQGDGILEGKILINRAHLAFWQKDATGTAQGLEEAWRQLAQLPESRWQGFALVAVGKLATRQAAQPVPQRRALALLALEALQKAAQVAQRLDDMNTLSHAMGCQGALYEQARRWSEAERLTDKAIFYARSTGSAEILYRWEWQRGRLAKAQGRLEEAKGWYRRAIQTLGRVRGDFNLGLRDTLDSFRELIGAVYYQLADLLLQQSKEETEIPRKEAILREARNTIETLKTAEVQNLFHDECVASANARQADLEQVAQKTVIYYPILLPDRLEILLTLPTGMRQIVVPVSSSALETEVKQLRDQLEEGEELEYLPHAQRLFQWLMEPVLAELAAAEVETLVVVPDGALRTIPFAALHDGKAFLVERFALAVTPSLQLTDPRSLVRGHISLLVNALSKGVQGFPALPNVRNEVKRVRSLFPSRVLLDESFTAPSAVGALRTEPYSIVHVASHGNFDHDPKETFLLTHDGRLTLDQLQEMIGQSKFRTQPVELLTLSACQTAVGDDRAALGLAGVAIKAGARSALASLWTVDDQATARLVTSFYQNLRDSEQSKAMALRHAQIQLIRDKATEHPGLWSAFILIGNWL
ncbi:MAG: CHAT domain-containing protein [Magnetococcus sp. MYC-9]